MNKNNVLQFPTRAKNKNENDLSNELLKIVNSLPEQPKPKKASKKKNTVKSSSDINEKDKSAINSVVTGNNNTTINNVITLMPEPKIKPKIIVKTGDGVVSAEQKADLQRLITEWVETHNSVKQRGKTYAAAWKALNIKMKVSSYHEIPQEKYLDAVKFLRSQIGRLRSMASAPENITDWRNKLIKSIHARCNVLQLQDWRQHYMMTTFAKGSMTELSDNELQRLYKTVMGKTSS